MAPTAAPVWSLPPSYVFKPSGHLIIAHYLVPMALRGDNTTVPRLVADGMNVFSTANPGALLCHPFSRRGNGEAWGYFYGAYPAGDERPVAGGGCWVRYGPEKGYLYGHGQGGAMEPVAFRRRFAFHVTWRRDDGRAVMVPTLWLMKEYRLNQGAAVFRAAAARAEANPRANMDCVVRKIFRMPLPPPSGYPGGVDEDVGYSSRPATRT